MSIEAMKQMAELLAVATFHSPELQAKRTAVLDAGLEAIEQAQKQEPIGEVVTAGVIRWKDKYPSLGTKLYTSPPQRHPLTDAQKQEHVAFVVKQYVNDGRPSIKGNGFDGLEIGYTREEADEFIAWVNNHIIATPQRQWVGLTDDDLHKYRVVFGGWAEYFARAIEAKLKAKNERKEKNT